MTRLSPYEKRLIVATLSAVATGFTIGAIYGWRRTARPPVTSLPGVRQ